MGGLMFGWEFPSHISGGLGTACLCLATALKDQRVELLFVVPQARGDESIPLINASVVVVDASQNTARVTEERWNPAVKITAVPAEIKPYSIGENTVCFPDAHFIVAGSGDLLPQMMERAAYRKISSRMHFTGLLKAEQMRQVLSVTQVYVMPSVSDPFGITPLDAVQAGVPVIGDIDALPDAIINLFRHNVLTNASRGNSKAETKSLIWKRAATSINQLYHELGSTLS